MQKREIKMGFAQLKQKAHDLFEEAGFLTHIQNIKSKLFHIFR